MYLAYYTCFVIGPYMKVKEIPADKTCTSLPQQWHKPRTDKIESWPLMKTTFAKSCKALHDEENTRKSAPVSCKHYVASVKRVKIRVKMLKILKN